MTPEEIKPGDKVHYCFPFGPKENGIVKSIKGEQAFVVYHCDNDWYNYEDYTGKLTPICRLFEGWVAEKNEKSASACHE